MLLAPLVQRLRILRPRGPRELARVLVCSAVGGFAGWIACSGRAVSRPEAFVIPEVTLDGKRLPIVEGDPKVTLEAARAIARAYVAGEVAIGTAGAGPRITRTREQLGARVEAARLASLAAALADHRSPLRRAHAQQVAAGIARPLQLPLPVTID